jgi:hypothetical protein
MTAGKDSKQPIMHFWACKYLALFAFLGGFPGLHEERIVRVQGTSVTGTITTIGNATPLHLVLGFVLMQIHCQCPPKQISEEPVHLPLNKEHKTTGQNK